MQQINKIKSWFYEMMDKIDKPLDGPSKKKLVGLIIQKIADENEVFAIFSKQIQRIVKRLLWATTWQQEIRLLPRLVHKEINGRASCSETESVNSSAPSKKS